MYKVTNGTFKKFHRLLRYEFKTVKNAIVPILFTKICVKSFYLTCIFLLYLLSLIVAYLSKGKVNSVKKRSFLSHSLYEKWKMIEYKAAVCEGNHDDTN